LGNADIKWPHFFKRARFSNINAMLIRGCTL